MKLIILPEAEKDLKDAIFKRFPYLVLYIDEEDAIIITSVAHQHRHPDNYLKNKDF